MRHSTSHSNPIGFLSTNPFSIDVNALLRKVLEFTTRRPSFFKSLLELNVLAQMVYSLCHLFSRIHLAKRAYFTRGGKYVEGALAANLHSGDKVLFGASDRPLTLLLRLSLVVCKPRLMIGLALAEGRLSRTLLMDQSLPPDG